MTLHQVTAPDGTVYEINAPEYASENDILNYAKNYHVQFPAHVMDEKPELNDKTSSAIGAGALSFGQGAMPVFDYAGAAGGAALEKVGILPPVSDKTNFGDIYDKRLQNIRDTERAFSDKYPNSDTALRIGGGIAGTVGTSAAFPGFGAAMAESPILSGGGYGFAQGFAGTHGSLPDRLVGGAIGMGLGATGGATAKYIVPGALRLTSGETLTPQAADIINQKISLAGLSPEEYAANLAKSSPEEFAGEVGGDPLRIYAQSQAKITGPNMQAARDAMRERIAGAPQRVQDIIGNTFTPQPNIEGLQQNIADMGSQLPELYAAADKDIVPRTPFLPQLNTPAGQAAMKSTVEKLANSGVQPQDAGIVIDKNSGFHGFQPQVPVSTVHEFSKSLGDLVKRNPLTGAVEGSDSVTIEGMRQGVTNALSENSDAFARANAVAAAQKQAQAAFDMGRKLARTSAGNTADQLMDRADQVFSPNELSYQKAGYAQGLGDAIQGAPLGTGNPVSRIANGNVQNSAASILDNPSEAQKFADLLLSEKQRMEFAQRGLGNSATAEALTSTPEMPPMTPHGMLAKLLDKVGTTLHGDANASAANLLYSTDPEEKAMLANAIMKSGSYYPVGNPYVYQSPSLQVLLNGVPSIPAQTMGALYSQGNQQ